MFRKISIIPKVPEKINRISKFPEKINKTLQDPEFGSSSGSTGPFVWGTTTSARVRAPAAAAALASRRDATRASRRCVQCAVCGEPYLIKFRICL